MKPVKAGVQFPQVEENILNYWKENRITEKGLAANLGRESFVFYDGPPFATGLPHYGHILAGTLKDIVPRYWVMKGRYVERRWGWDCHGLPVEFEMEKELGLGGATEVLEYGVAKFNEACRSIVQRYTQEWEQTITRTGRWADFKNGYRTMDASFMETVWWASKQLWDKGLVYEGYRVMPYSWRISTPLSNFEAGLNYKEVQDPAVTVRFKSVNKNRYFLAWTTTPWTLPSNLALAVHPEVAYVEIKTKTAQEHYVLAEARLAAVFPDSATYEVVSTFTGASLQGEKYEPLFGYFAKQKNAFQILADSYVTTTDGTGIVHNAPAFGEDDFRVCRAAGIGIVDPVDAEGKFTAEVPEYQGQQVKEADKSIIKDLKARGAIIKHDTLVHNYPFCWRSDTPLIYKAISTWFVKLDPIKQKLLANNAKTHWVPEHIRDGRFGNWLESARDWNISRNRFWGTPIPIWRTEDGKESLCIGSIEELEKLSGKRPTDIHKHFVDDIVVTSPTSGKPMRRIPEVFDCWFESGSMPFAQQHYPFENREKFEKNFPAQFIAEGVDQTRGWFYTLSVLSSALFDCPAFKNVIVNGLVLAEDGKKMSKRLKNYPDPNYVMNTYGADALRAYLMSSPASHAEDLRFSEKGVQEMVRSVILPFWNAYSFFVTYALADGWKPSDFSKASLGSLNNDLDKWMVSRLQSLVHTVDSKMAVYHLYEVIPAVVGFIDDLTNWYIRLNRRRFWSEEATQDKAEAYATLYYTLSEFCKVLAPILPFVTEEVYQNLCREVDNHESVHLTAFPQAHKQWLHPELECQMALVQNVVAMGRTCRSTHKLKTRQPLREIKIITKNPQDKQVIERFAAIIQNELNVKSVSFSSDESQLVNLTAKANAKVLGPRLGQKMKLILEKVRNLPPDAVAELERSGSLVVEGEKILITEVAIERQPKQAGAIQSQGSVTVWLDSTLDDSLIAEGRAREFVNRIQKLRKDRDLNVADRIHVQVECSEALKASILSCEAYIKDETLAKTISFKAPGAGATEDDIDGDKLKYSIEPVG
jgi:isoleucyl-tRNA synthetase